MSFGVAQQASKQTKQTNKKKQKKKKKKKKKTRSSSSSHTTASKSNPKPTTHPLVQVSPHACNKVLYCCSLLFGKDGKLDKRLRGWLGTVCCSSNWGSDHILAAGPLAEDWKDARAVARWRSRRSAANNGGALELLDEQVARREARRAHPASGVARAARSTR